MIMVVVPGILHLLFGLDEEKFIEFGIDKFDLETLLDDLFGDFNKVREVMF